MPTFESERRLGQERESDPRLHVYHAVLPALGDDDEQAALDRLLNSSETLTAIQKEGEFVGNPDLLSGVSYLVSGLTTLSKYTHTADRCTVIVFLGKHPTGRKLSQLFHVKPSGFAYSHRFSQNYDRYLKKFAASTLDETRKIIIAGGNRSQRDIDELGELEWKSVTEGLRDMHNNILRTQTIVIPAKTVPDSITQVFLNTQQSKLYVVDLLAASEKETGVVHKYSII